MPLPFFLEPLALIPYYHRRMKIWFQESDQRSLIGPLEQAVAAIVIIGLAMQTPPSFPELWATSTIPLPQDVPGQPRHFRLLGPNASGEISIANEQWTSDPHRHSKLSVFQLLSGGIDPLTIIILLLSLNIAILLLPREVKARLKTSWDLFWPPWQNRSATATSAEPPARSSLNLGEKDGVRDKALESSTSGFGGEKKAESQEVRERARTSSNAKQTTLSEKVEANSKGLEGEEEQEKRSAGEERTKELEKKDTEPGRVSSTARDGEKLSLSERARKAENSDIGTEKRAFSSTDSKGKQRMEGERPSEKNSSASDPGKDVRTSIEKGDKDKGEIKEKDKQVKVKDKERTVETASSSETEDRADTDSPSASETEIETETDLMAGDYRPLKSALKKSKKKPKQRKNIHHNYFMTMRGHRPALVPFPHGLHPKPHHPRNSLWWDNISSNVEHIMALPIPPKIPEDKEEDKDEVDTGKEKKREESEEKKKTSSSESRDESKVKSESKESSETKPKTSSSTDIKDKDKEKEKEKEKERAKLKAQAEAEAKAKAMKKEEEAKAATSSSSSRSGSSSNTSGSIPIPLNPQIEKATFISQGLLCVLLYYVHQQLGFLLLLFFVWQFLDKLEPVADTASHPPVVARRETSSHSASSSSAPSAVKSASSTDKSKETSSGKISSKGPAEPTSASKEKEAAHPPAAASNNQELIGKLQEVEAYVKKYRTLKQLTDEQKSKLEKAEERRRDLKRKLAAVKGNNPSASSTSARATSSEENTCEPAAERIPAAHDPLLGGEQETVGVDKGEKEDVASSAENESSSTATKRDNLKAQIKKIEEFIINGRKVESPSIEAKEKLANAEMQRRGMRKKLLELEGISHSPQKDQLRSNSSPSGGPESKTETEPKLTKVDQLKEEIRRLESYIIKGRKLPSLTDEQKAKILRAEGKRKLLKKELEREKAGVGSSGLSVDEKDALANNNTLVV